MRKGITAAAWEGRRSTESNRAPGDQIQETFATPRRASAPRRRQRRRGAPPLAARPADRPLSAEARRVRDTTQQRIDDARAGRPPNVAPLAAPPDESNNDDAPKTRSDARSRARLRGRAR